jgi:hypothetical protein
MHLDSVADKHLNQRSARALANRDQPGRGAVDTVSGPATAECDTGDDREPRVGHYYWVEPKLVDAVPMMCF